MRGNGISYDTGFVRNGASSREAWDPEIVRRELRIIRDDLHANAVRIMGGDPERLELAASSAAELGLEVWFSPYPAEPDVQGVPARRQPRRPARAAPGRPAPPARADPRGRRPRQRVPGPRRRRSSARGLEIVEYDRDTGAPLRLDGAYARDEEGQATYLRELLEVFEAEGVDSAFVFTFALHDYPYRPDGDPRDDLDLASYGIVKVLDHQHGETYPDLPWEPKAAFRMMLADRRAGKGTS